MLVRLQDNFPLGKRKVNLYHSTPWRHKGESGGITPLILNLGARWRRMVNITTNRFTPRAGLDVFEKWKIPRTRRDSNLGSLIRYPRCYTDHPIQDRPGKEHTVNTDFRLADIAACSCSTQRQAWELISGPSSATKARLLSFNRAQSRVVTDLLRHNTLGRHLYVMGLSNNPTCGKCGIEKETSVHILCVCEAFASLRHAHLGSFFLDPEDIRKLSIGAIWNYAKGTGLI